MSFAQTLKKLFIDSNMLTALKITPQLEELIADNNHITTIEVVNSSYYKLTTLSVQNNNFESISPAYPFYNLQELSVAQNAILGIHLPTIVSRLPRLKSLNVSHSAVATVGSASDVKQTRLKVLDLSNNKLTAEELEKVKNVPRLETFAIGGNQFDEFAADVVLNNLPKLKTLGLSGSELTCGFTKYIEEIAKELHCTVETFSGTEQWQKKCGEAEAAEANGTEN
ncbi:leucine-rich repeat-containing protein 1 [Anopheles sinensis]|uniref:Leucine-rich repeat-containing protein 1 n=1 Tax=Anopheles sinensis TaxID=74873 RepID=A0A084WJS4_ANOSI|nr:leucine-rich repeat-containing protein 1 [Anopheles sinensis]